MTNTNDALADAVFADLAQRVKFATLSITHCLDQLSEQDIWWRPHDTHNSVGNLILHVCGNLRQFIISGVGQTPDLRKRDEEFSEQGPIPIQELKDRLAATVAEIEGVLAGLSPADLLATRPIRDQDMAVLSALFTSIYHYKGHAEQIIYITRIRVGESYEFGSSPPPPPR